METDEIIPNSPQISSIEQTLKNIVIDKCNDTDFIESLTDEKIKSIEKFFTLYTGLQNEKDIVIKKLYELLNRKTSKSQITTNLLPTQIVLDEFTYNNKTYYSDKNNGIWNRKAELIGIIEKSKQSNPIYHFFDKLKKIDNIL